jgi:membrane protease YdiL (CAAX protease family)
LTKPRPFPSPLQAALLTTMGIFFMAVATSVAAMWTSVTSALGIGTVIGLGAAGTLGATSVPPPHGARVGLRGIAWRHLLPILLLLPVVLLASEVDNVVKAVLPTPDVAQIVEQTQQELPTDTQLSLLETSIVAVGLVPVVEEWFFRGVLQQGLVASLGVPGGILVTALLFALGHGALGGISPEAWAAYVAQTLVLGLVLGYVRHATGSLLASILVHMGINGLGVLGMALPEWLAVPGYNVPGAHTPIAVLAPSVLAVAIALWLLSREHPEPAPPLPAVEATPDD